MKSSARSIILTLAVLTGVAACSRDDGGGSAKPNPSFATAEEAAAQAQSDLVAALQQAEGLDLNIDAARLRSAQAAELVVHAEVDFARILSADSVASLMDLASEKSRIVPFVDGRGVVAVAEVGRTGGSWRITGLANRPVTADLNRAGLARPAPGAVTLYEVPNLNLMIYGVRGDQGERYHLDAWQFSLPEGVEIGTLYPVLRARAQEFERQYGAALRKERLVK